MNAAKTALLSVLFGAAAAPEPAGYWNGSAQAPVPATISGGSVIHTQQLAALTGRGRVVLVDVAAMPKRPATLAAGALWMPLPHRDLPGSLWFPDAGLGVMSEAGDAALRHDLQQATGGDFAAAIVVYCHHACWLSWNAAKRILSYGYRHVTWYPDGVEGWSEAGHPLSLATPRS